MTSVHDLISEAERLLAEHQRILDRIEDELEPDVIGAEAGLRRAEEQLRYAIDLREDAIEALEEIREQMDSRPDALAMAVGDVRSRMDLVLDDGEGEIDDAD